MQKINVSSRTARKGFGLIVLITILLSGCGGGGGAGSSSSGDWYYHWRCNGDSECLALGPGTVGQTEGTINPRCNSPQSCCGDTAKMCGWKKDESRRAVTVHGKYTIT